MREKAGVITTVMIALFAAICYASLVLFFIPVGPMFVHFGNLLVVTAALLLGGWQGGLAGSVGMGLFDLFNGHIDAAPKTFVLKFLIGLTVGMVFRALAKREKFPQKAFIAAAAGAFSIASGIYMYYLLRWGNLSLKALMLIPSFMVLFLLLLGFVLVGRKCRLSTSYGVIAAACGLLVNIIGETGYKFISFLILGSHVRAALAGAVLAQASTLINAVVAVAGGVALWIPLRKPFGQIMGH